MAVRLQEGKICKYCLRMISHPVRGIGDILDFKNQIFTYYNFLSSSRGCPCLKRVKGDAGKSSERAGVTEA